MNSTIQTHAIDQTLQLLANQYRRRVLRYLMSNGETSTTVEELTVAITNGDSSVGDGRDRPEQLAIKLHHTHLPRLADDGFVDYDPRTRTVRYQSDDLVEELLRTIETNR